MCHWKERGDLLAKNASQALYFVKNCRWQDADRKLQNSQITLDMVPSVDKTWRQIEQAWLSEFSPDESSVKTA